LSVTRRKVQRSSRTTAFAVIAAGTILGLAGTDLVLPAVPGLPRVLGGTIERGQLVLAAFTAGAAIGLLLFGEFGARFDQRRVLAASLLLYGFSSVLCAWSPSLDVLIALRFVQGASGVAAAVFAPGMIRALYDAPAAIGAMGRLGSLESLAPALAPIAGGALLAIAGWQTSFFLLAVLSIALGLLIAARPALLPAVIATGRGHYGRVIARPGFVRLAVSHAFTLGALLIVVFGAPTVFTNALGGSLGHFIAMQVIGITVFIFAANCAGRLVQRFGAGRVIRAGAIVFWLGTSGLFAYPAAGGGSIAVVIALMVLLNAGLGLRGPPGFYAAIVAAGDDARGGALMVLAILATASIGTALVAPFIGAGLIALAGPAWALSTVAAALVARGPE